MGLVLVTDAVRPSFSTSRQHHAFRYNTSSTVPRTVTSSLRIKEHPVKPLSRRFPTRVLPLTRHGSEVTLYLQPCCHTVTLRLAVALSSLSSQGVALINR